MNFYMVGYCDEATCEGNIEIGNYRNFEDAYKAFSEKVERVRKDYDCWKVTYEEHWNDRRDYVVFDDGEFEHIIVWIEKKKLL